MKLRFVLGFVAAALVTACGSPKPPPSPATPAPKPKPKEVAAADELQAEEEFVYSPVGKRDPFRSLLGRVATTQEPAEDPLCGQLCSWDLEQLRLVAVVSGMASPLAMVQDPKGNGYNLRRGTSIGKRNGKVAEILRDRIVVTEFQRLGTGEVLPVQTELILRGTKANQDEAPLDLLVTDE